MPEVIGNVRTWGLEAFSADELLLVVFVPSTTGVSGSTLLPLREERVEPDASGFFSATLAQTTNITNDAYYRMRFEWFQRHPVQGWRQKGSSEVPGELRVPAAGGRATDLLSIQPVRGGIFHGYGPPPRALKDSIYIDRSGTKLGIYVPPGRSI